jgi:maltooligosyltrehalose trehalohydrolase
MPLSPTELDIARRLPIGAELLADGRAHFRVWAPKRQQVDVAVVPQADNLDRIRYVELQPEGQGYFSGIVDDALAGTLYGFRLDGENRLFPDPAARYQPQGPGKLSQLVDPNKFSWTDQAWAGVKAAGQVLYEMHIGTFTSEGTFAAATRQLDELARAGMTVIEVMPVADFPGEFGWGYDGVCMFAPSRLYGRPDDFRTFVDRAHVAGLGVILDVVYNHFGTVENYIPQFSDDYKSERHKNEWGDAINFDSRNAGPVREFFEANVRHWIQEYHLDGFRFDATQAIHDDSSEHILGVLTRVAREAAGKREVYFVTENEPQDVRAVRSAHEGGYGMHAIWNDDFHHAAMVRLTGKNAAYFSDYLGMPEEFVAAIKRGFIYQGQLSQWQSKPRGTPTYGLPATAFITFLQNHDQVANSERGERIHTLTSPGRMRAMTALWLLSPQTPLFLQGQEFGASTPFLYFADYQDELGRLVAEGRGKFLAQFPDLATPEAQRNLPNPADRAVFERSRLDFREREQHRAIYDLHIDLLRMRREDPVFRAQRADRLDAAALSPDCLAVRFFGEEGMDRLLLVNWGRDLHLTPIPQPLLAPPLGMGWTMTWTSESVRYGGNTSAPPQIDDGWRIPGEAAILLQVAPLETPLEDPPENTP